MMAVADAVAEAVQVKGMPHELVILHWAPWADYILCLGLTPSASNIVGNPNPNQGWELY